MKLSYRGSAYESSDSAIDAAPTEVIGKYRGTPVRLTTPIGVPLPQAVLKFTYRGSHYIGLR